MCGNTQVEYAHRTSAHRNQLIARRNVRFLPRTQKNQIMKCIRECTQYYRSYSAHNSATIYVYVCVQLDSITRRFDCLVCSASSACQHVLTHCLAQNGAHWPGVTPPFRHFRTRGTDNNNTAHRLLFNRPNNAWALREFTWCIRGETENVLASKKNPNKQRRMVCYGVELRFRCTNMWQFISVPHIHHIRTHTKQTVMTPQDAICLISDSVGRAQHSDLWL